MVTAVISPAAHAPIMAMFFIEKVYEKVNPLTHADEVLADLKALGA